MEAYGTLYNLVFTNLWKEILLIYWLKYKVCKMYILISSMFKRKSSIYRCFFYFLI